MERKGIAQRRQLGRSDLATLAKRKFDPIHILREAAQGRIPKLLPIKFKLMSGSPFVFYRGSVEIMAADLAAGKNTGITAQLCGDAHVKNFGFYASPGADIIPTLMISMRPGADRGSGMSSVWLSALSLPDAKPENWNHAARMRPWSLPWNIA